MYCTSNRRHAQAEAVGGNVATRNGHHRCQTNGPDHALPDTSMQAIRHARQTNPPAVNLATHGGRQQCANCARYMWL